MRSAEGEQLTYIDYHQAEPLPTGISTLSNQHSCYTNFINDSVDYNKLFDFLLTTPKQFQDSSVQYYQKFNDNLNETIMKNKEAVTEANFDKLPNKIKKLRAKLKQTHSVTSYHFQPDYSKDEAYGLFKNEISFETYTEGQKFAVHQFLLSKLKTYVDLSINLIKYETRYLLKEHSANNPRGYINTYTDEKEVYYYINQLTEELLRGILFYICKFTIDAFLKFRVDTQDDLYMAQDIEKIIGYRYDIKLESMGIGYGQARMLKCSDMFNDFTDWDNIKATYDRARLALKKGEQETSADYLMIMRFKNYVMNYGYSVSDDPTVLPEWVVNQEYHMFEFFNLLFMKKGYPTLVAKRYLKVCMHYSIEVQEKKTDALYAEMYKNWRPSVSSDEEISKSHLQEDNNQNVLHLENDIAAIKKKKYVANEQELEHYESGQLLQDKLYSLLKSYRQQFTNKIANYYLIPKESK